MPDYRRAIQPGGTFFFTVVTAERAPLFADPSNQQLLHDAIVTCARTLPFELVAMVLLPDHLHAIWTLIENDSDYATRWRAIKTFFTREYLARGNRESDVTASQSDRGNRGVWQRRYWEHMIRDETDLRRHLDYIHYNPVKHGLVQCPHAHAASSFHRYVSNGLYAANWACSCHGSPKPPDFRWTEGFDLE